MSFIRTKEINGNKYQYLVRNHREGGTVKQEVIQYIGPAGSVAPNDIKEEYRDTLGEDQLNKLGTTQENMKVEPVDIDLPKIEENPENVNNTTKFTLTKKGEDFEIEVKTQYDKDSYSSDTKQKITVKHDGETYYADHFDEDKGAIIFSKYGSRPEINGKEVGGISLPDSKIKGINETEDNMKTYIKDRKEEIKEAPLLFRVKDKEYRHGSKRIFEIKGIADDNQREDKDFIEKYQGRKSIRGTGIDNISAKDLDLEENKTYTSDQIKSLVQKKHSEKISKNEKVKKKLNSMKIKDRESVNTSSFEGTISKVEYEGETYNVRTGGFDNSYGEGPKEANWIPVYDVEEDVDNETESLLIKKASENR